MKRFTDDTVFSGFVTAWFFAALPTTRSPSLRKPSTDGVVRSPSAFTRISGSEPSMTAMAEFVVPKSIPRILLIILLPLCWSCYLSKSLAVGFCLCAKARPEGALGGRRAAAWRCDPQAQPRFDKLDYII